MSFNGCSHSLGVLYPAGAACARALGAEGAAVAVADIDAPGAAETAAALKADGIKAMPIACDVRLKSEVDAMIAQTVMALGGVDILVANAGAGSAGTALHAARSMLMALCYTGMMCDE